MMRIFNFFGNVNVISESAGAQAGIQIERRPAKGREPRRIVRADQDPPEMIDYDPIYLIPDYSREGR